MVHFIDAYDPPLSESSMRHKQFVNSPQVPCVNANRMQGIIASHVDRFSHFVKSQLSHRCNPELFLYSSVALNLGAIAFSHILYYFVRVVVASALTWV